jgi:crossover junction endodeoxyribonuclease RusA
VNITAPSCFDAPPFDGAIFVPGHPVTEGSKTVISSGGKTWMVNGRRNFGRLAVWRSAVAEVLKYEVRFQPIAGAVEAEMLFLFAKPKRPKYGWPVSGDVDKLVRAVLDAATGIAYSDDAHVTKLIASKSWTTGQEGVWVAFRAADVT